MSAPLRYFEDLSVGDCFRSFSRTLSEAEILEFAWAYDPQPFHISLPDGAQSIFGGLIASGLHTLAISSRLGLEASGLIGANAGGRGLDALRWFKPVYPGDSLYVTAEILTIQAPRPGRDLGDVRVCYRTYNQDDVLVMSFELMQLVKLRPDSPA